MPADAIAARALLGRWMLDCAIEAHVEDACQYDVNDIASINDYFRYGIVPCRVLNYLCLGTVPCIYFDLSIWSARKNLEAFLRGCQTLGVSKRYHFNSLDLLQIGDFTLFWKTVARLVIFSLHNSKRSDIPTIDIAQVKNALEKWPKSFPEPLRPFSASLTGNDEWRFQIDVLTSKIDDIQANQQKMIGLLHSVLQHTESNESSTRQNCYQIHELKAEFFETFGHIQNQLNIDQSIQESLKRPVQNPELKTIDIKRLSRDRNSLCCDSSNDSLKNTTIRQLASNTMSAKDTPLDSIETLNDSFGDENDTTPITLLDDISETTYLPSLSENIVLAVQNERQQLLMPKELISIGLSNTELKRQFYVHELITTEEDYCKNLEVVLTCYLVEMRKKRLLSEYSISVLFSNMDQIHRVSKDFLGMLKCARNSDMIVSAFDCTLIEQIKAFECYFEYLVRFPEAEATRIRLERGIFGMTSGNLIELYTCMSEHTNNFLMERSNQSSGLQSISKTFSAYLILEILKYTAKEDAQYDYVQQAIMILEQLLKKSNLEMPKTEEVIMLKSLFPELLTKLSFKSPFRHGAVMMSDLELTKFKERYLILFDDFLYIFRRRSTSNRGSFRSNHQAAELIVPTTHIILIGGTDTNFKGAYRLTLQFVGQEAPGIVLEFHNDDEKMSWNHAFVYTRSLSAASFAVTTMYASEGKNTTLSNVIPRKSSRRPRSPSPSLGKRWHLFPDKKVAVNLTSLVIDPSALGNNTELLAISTEAVEAQDIGNVGFSKNTFLRIVNADRHDWWKAEMNGVAFMVPVSAVILADISSEIQAKETLSLCNSNIGKAWLKQGGNATAKILTVVENSESALDFKQQVNHVDTAETDTLINRDSWKREKSATGHTYYYNPLTKDAKWHSDHVHPVPDLAAINSATPNAKQTTDSSMAKKMSKTSSSLLSSPSPFSGIDNSLYLGDALESYIDSVEEKEGANKTTKFTEAIHEALLQT